MVRLCMVWRGSATAQVCTHRLNRIHLKKRWQRRFPHISGGPNIPHSHSCNRVPSRPLRPRRGRFGTLLQFQARAGMTLAFRAVAHSLTDRHRAHRPAQQPRARSGKRTATLPWRGGRGAGKGAPPPPPQLRRPAGILRRPRKGLSLCRAAHVRTAWGAAETAHGRAGGSDRLAAGSL